MNTQSKLGRPVRLGLISSGVPAEYSAHVRRSNVLSSQSRAAVDTEASEALCAVDKRAEQWIAFNVCVGEGVLSGERYLQAVRWLLDAGVDAILCLCPLQDEELRVVGANRHARRLGIPLIVADSPEHVAREDWAHEIVVATADSNLSSGEAVWATEPERCRIGGQDRHAVAAGVVAGVAMAELERALPRVELMDSLRAWTLLPESRLAS